MKSLPLVTVAAATLIVGACASNGGGKSVSELTAGKFVTYSCESDKSFQTRFNADTGTVRIRTKEGGAELSREARDLYRDSITGDWILTLREGKDTELVHGGKAIYKNCSVQTDKV